MSPAARRIVFLVHYFPPLNSSGGKRVEAMSKYFARAGREVTVVTTVKSAADGPLTEEAPAGVRVMHVDFLGRLVDSVASVDSVPSSGNRPLAPGGWMRRLKNLVMRWFGQLPEPRLPFALAMLSPVMSPSLRRVLRDADVVIGSNPPWPMLLAAVFIGWRFDRRVVLDYRDHFSECHEIPGSAPAKAIEKLIDRALARRATRVVTVSSPMAQYYSAFNPEVTVVLNGYDPELIDAVRSRTRWQPRAPGQALTIRYLGLITPDRIPRNLLGALDRAVRAGRLSPASMRLEFYGECSVLQAFVRSDYSALLPMFSFMAPVAYRLALELTVTADYLLFAETSYKKSLSAQGILTTKLFEYLAVGRPIIADIDPTTLAGRMILQCGGSHFVANAVDAFETHLTAPDFFTPAESTDHPFVKTLSRSSQAEQYLRLLDTLPDSAARSHR